MKYILLFTALISIGLSSCQKDELPTLVGHKFTYSIETDGIVDVTYSDAKGAFFTETIVNNKWHKTYDVDLGNVMNVEFYPRIDCHVGYYFAQDGLISNKQEMLYREAWHGLKGSFLIK